MRRGISDGEAEEILDLLRAESAPSPPLLSAETLEQPTRAGRRRGHPLRALKNCCPRCGERLTLLSQLPWCPRCEMSVSLFSESGFGSTTLRIPASDGIHKVRPRYEEARAPRVSDGSQIASRPR